jgi:trk system potassium uptake protein TrkA
MPFEPLGVDMRVAVAGAGAVGRSIAGALVDAGHTVLLIERERRSYRPELVPAADWMLADACEVATLSAAGIDGCDVVMAAAGEDRANLVFSLLAKREFAVPRVVARVNRAENQWLFTPDWGVDVAVSTPSALVSAVGEAVSVGDVVELMTLQHSDGRLVEITLPDNAALVGHAVREVPTPEGAVLVGVVRAGTLFVPGPGQVLHAGDEIVFLVSGDAGPLRALADRPEC